MSSKDLYQWRAIFTDGTLLDEFEDEHAPGHGFAEIGDQQVEVVSLVLPEHDWYEAHRAQVPAGATPVFFRRRRIEINPDNGEHNGTITTHCIGWRREDGRGVYLFTFADGSTLLTDNFQAV